MNLKRPFSDTHVDKGTMVRLVPSADLRTVKVQTMQGPQGDDPTRVLGPTHSMRRVDLVRMHKWLTELLYPA